MIPEIFNALRENMNKTIESLMHEFGRIRTGRASLSLLDGIKVDYYGTQTPINQIAKLSTPESRLIVIQPWDKNLISPIEKAILSSDLGLNPANDGKIIRIVLPPLTEDRRKELVKVAKKHGEERKVSLRNFRREANERLKKAEEDKKITEDELHKNQDRVQEILEEYIKKVDELVEKKTKEIMEV